MRTLSKAIITGVLLGLLLSGCGSRDKAGLTVIFPKLGSADSALIMTDSATVIIDTGEKNDGDALLELLQQYHRETVDLLIISHYDKDHVGGAAELLSGCSVERVLGSTSPKDSEEMAAYLAALEAAGLQEEVPGEALTISLGDLQLVVDPPKKKVYERDQSNNSSVVVTVRYLDTQFLFTGDAMAERTEEFSSQLTPASYDLIKIPHHGRDTDTVSALLPAMKSGGAAVVTSSKKEPESGALLNLLETSGLPCYRTLDGDVVVTSDGKTLTISQLS